MSQASTAARSEEPGPKLSVSSTEVAVEMVDVNKWFGEFHVLKQINLKVMGGERIVICGPSGSGKSTMIRCINRLEEHQAGRIVVDGVELTDDLKRIDEVRRDVGMVFQQFNLFPHLTILENCTLAPIWVRKMSKRDAEEVAMRYLTRVKIPEQAKKYPGQLSGGQQQRVAIARSAASPAFRPRTRRSGSATLPSAVMCGQRLKCWNTMPISRRISRKVRVRMRPRVPSGLSS
jgi:general L-amino acid transport system ATP-binding protein